MVRVAIVIILAAGKIYSFHDPSLILFYLLFLFSFQDIFKILTNEKKRQMKSQSRKDILCTYCFEKNQSSFHLTFFFLVFFFFFFVFVFFCFVLISIKLKYTYW